MICFNTVETLLFNIGISLFSCIITLIIICNFKRNFADTHDVQLLCKINALILMILLTDIGMWVLNGKSGTLMRVLSYVDIMLYFIMQIAVALMWLRYAFYRIIGRNISRKHEIILIFIPFAFLSMLVVTSPFDGLCFYLDDANYYHRGVLSIPMSIVILLYLLSVSVISLTHYKNEVLNDRKKELLTIAFFVIPPFVGGVMQTIFYGISIIWPCAVISSLLVLLNKESQLMSQDSITCLNNRRNMEKYLITYDDEQNRAITLIMLDINDFKHINDQYGHSWGDLALMQMANILRTTFNGTSAFLARYGGDEFIIIIPQGEEDNANEAVQKIKNNLVEFNRTKQLEFQLSISVGYAISLEKTDNMVANLFKEADANMYREKALYHQNKEAEYKSKP